MPFEAIKGITEAETEAKQRLAEAEAEAKRLNAAAEAKGKAEIAAAAKKAEEELSELLQKTEEKAVAEAGKIRGAAEIKKAVLKAKSDSRVDRAAQLIAERIVNS